jgi:hypothetical protein
MALLDEAIEASGGLTRWNALRKFTLQLSIDGNLFSRTSSSVQFKDIAAGGCLRNPLIRLNGFAGPGEYGIYQPECVTIKDPDGQVLWTRHHPHWTFPCHAQDMFLDEIHLVFLCGFSIWNYLTTPFTLAHPDVRIEELPPWQERNQHWRRLRAILPPSFVMPSREQIFYFDAAGLQRRTDYQWLGINVVNYSWAHQEFCGVVIPTLRRSLILEADGTVIAKPPLMDVEIFDAAFE